MVSPPQIPRNAERAQCAGRVALVVEEEHRGQQHTHYKGWDTPKDNPASGRLGSCRAYRGGAKRRPRQVRWGEPARLGPTSILRHQSLLYAGCGIL